MNPTHHLSDELRLGAATGGLDEARAVFAACHLHLCAKCREEVAVLEALGGAMLAQAAADPPEVAPDPVLARLMAALDEPAPLQTPPLPPLSLPPEWAWMPAPLARYLGEPAGKDGLRWRTLIPAFAWELPVGPVRLARMAGGSRVPTHAHDGEELNLVLTGGFTDPFGHFQRGDVSYHADGEPHEIHIDEGEPCTLLVVTDNPLVPLGWWSRFVFALAGGF